MNWQDFSEAVEDAETTVKRGDAALRRLARLFNGRNLKHLNLPGPTLAHLKRELRDFDLRDLTWKS